jgi:hypothetical protein
VSNTNAIYNGGLAGKYQFLGSSTAEVVARSGANGSGWNGDYSLSVNESSPWFIRGVRSNHTVAYPGVFAFIGETGGVNAWYTHRTILSGY